MEQLSIFISIVIINFVLSGDNAMVIAMASRSLPPPLQKKAIVLGSVGAIGLRVILTALIAIILTIPYLHAIGGILLLYISFQLLHPEEEGKQIQSAGSLGEAIKVILAADLIMSLDNTLALAALARGNWFLLILGLATTIPIIIFCSNLILFMMKKFPFILYIGAGILGWTAGQMLIQDPKIGTMIQNIWTGPFDFLSTAIPLCIATMVIVYGLIASRKSKYI